MLNYLLQDSYMYVYLNTAAFTSVMVFFFPRKATIDTGLCLEMSIKGGVCAGNYTCITGPLAYLLLTSSSMVIKLEVNGRISKTTQTKYRIFSCQTQLFQMTNTDRHKKLFMGTNTDTHLVQTFSFTFACLHFQ